MNTKAERLKADLVYNPVPHYIAGAHRIARYIRDTFKCSYYLSRVLADYVIEKRQADLARVETQRRE